MIRIEKMDTNNFTDITDCCEDLSDFIEGADEGTAYKEDGIIYYKIRENGDCEVFYYNEKNNLIYI